MSLVLGLSLPGVIWNTFSSEESNIWAILTVLLYQSEI